MKDFIKWLGVNEKIAKVVVWLLIIMIFLIVTNTMLESFGIPYYKITYENIKQLKSSKTLDYLMSWLTIILSFYSVVLLVFRTKEAKNIFKYAILFLILNIIFSWHTPYVVTQIFIVIYILLFCYLYSIKKWKYVLYGLAAYIASILIQGIWYLSKARYLEYGDLSDTTRLILSLDYFIIMGVIILVKEIYLKKKRGE